MGKFKLYIFFLASDKELLAVVYWVYVPRSWQQGVLQFQWVAKQPCREDLRAQPRRSPRGSSRWGLKAAQPMDIPTGAAPGQSCRLRRAACGGAGALGAWLSVATRVEQCLKGGSHGTKPCWSSAWRAAACGKPTWDHFGKDGILWEEATWNREWPWKSCKAKGFCTEYSPHSLLPCGASWEEVGKSGWEEGVFSMLLVLTALVC